MDPAEASKKLDGDATPPQLTPEIEKDTTPKKPSAVSTKQSSGQRRSASISKIPVIASGSSSTSLATPQPSASSFKRPPGPRDRRVSLMSAEENKDEHEGGEYRRLSAADSVSNSTSSVSTVGREDIVFLRRCENTLTTLITEQSREAEFTFKHAVVLYLPRAGRVVAVPDGDVREIQLWAEASGNALGVTPSILGHYAEGSMGLRWPIGLLKTLFSADGKEIIVQFNLYNRIGGAGLRDQDQEQPEHADDRGQEIKEPTSRSENQMQSKEPEIDYPHGFIELLNDEEDAEAVQFCFDFGQACGSKLGNWAKEKNQDAPYAFFGSVGPLNDGKLFATVFSDVDQYEAIIAKPQFLDGSGVRMLAHCCGNNTYVAADFRTLMECFRNNIKLKFSFYSAGTDPTYTGPADLLKAAIASPDTYLNEIWRPHNLTRGTRAPTDIDTGIHQRSEVRLIQDKDSSDLLATSAEAQFRMVCERTFDKALVQVALVCYELMPFALIYELERGNILIHPVDEERLRSLGVFDSSNKMDSERIGYRSHHRTIFTCEVKRLLRFFSEDAETIKGDIKMNSQHSFRGRSNIAVPRNPDPMVQRYGRQVYTPTELYGGRVWDPSVLAFRAFEDRRVDHSLYSTRSLTADNNSSDRRLDSTEKRRLEPLNGSNTSGLHEPKIQVHPPEGRDTDNSSSFGSATQVPRDSSHASSSNSTALTLRDSQSPQLLLTTSVSYGNPASEVAAETEGSTVSTATDSPLIVNDDSALARKVNISQSTEVESIDNTNGQIRRRESSGSVQRETEPEPPTTTSPSSSSPSLDKGEENITFASSRDLEHAIIHHLPATLNLLLTHGNLKDETLHSGVRLAYNSLQEALARKNTLQRQLVAEGGGSVSSSGSAEGLIATPRPADGQLHKRAEEEEEELFDVPASTAKSTILHFVKKKGEVDAEAMDLEEQLIEKRSRESKEAEQAEQAWERRVMGLEKEWQDEEDQAVEKLEMMVMVMMAVMFMAVYLAAAYW
ncbi:hypothetical protein KC340_g3923 [Hortaea werneckii]|nr:hypothetical protein KC342_g2861 [Hortaea werneckii]KAI7103806.1 hypothetical protein KC339_g4970 [Hortaea werneckii]KAI7245158.1 hypothetical protein KC365_g729 [Hortaea werneckii]KAI7331202.1 hypothetical protein KC340_g3923 [Hortaea werneckii]KAI7406430.1 hypothetical protein KC328_g974 [Hortaea werneckii]